MLINKDFSLALRAGHSIDKHTLRKEQEAGVIVFFCVVFSILLLVLSLVFVPQANAQVFKPAVITNDQHEWIENLADAIFLAEGGDSAQYLYGIRSVRYDTKEEARAICIRTIRNNIQRYSADGFRRFSDYIEYLGSRYAPLEASNDPKGLNRNWTINVRYLMARGER